MGQTRNTAADVDRGIVRMMMRDHEPQTLTPAELDLEHEPITRPPRPIACSAWVRYADLSTQIDGQLVAWTARACAVRWKTPDDVEHRAWLWGSAVTSSGISLDRS